MKDQKRLCIFGDEQEASFLWFDGQLPLCYLHNELFTKEYFEKVVKPEFEE